MRIEVQGSQELVEALRTYGQRAEAAIDRAVTVTAVEVRSDIQRAIQRGPKTGRTYMRGSVSHIASAPGEAPATDTGTLVSSIVFNRKGPMEAEIESRLPYASMLEFGTSRMAPRPSWTPAIEKAGPKLQDRIERALSGLGTGT